MQVQPRSCKIDNSGTTYEKREYDTFDNIDDALSLMEDLAQKAYKKYASEHHYDTLQLKEDLGDLKITLKEDNLKIVFYLAFCNKKTMATYIFRAKIITETKLL